MILNDQICYPSALYKHIIEFVVTCWIPEIIFLMFFFFHLDVGGNRSNEGVAPIQPYSIFKDVHDDHNKSIAKSVI